MAVPQSIHRVPGFLSSLPNWLTPTPLTHKKALLPPLGPRGGGDKFTCGGGGGGFPIQRIGTVINVYYLYNIIALRSMPYPSLRPFANHTFGLFFFILTACSRIGCCYPYCLLSCNSNCPYCLFSSFSVMCFSFSRYPICSS